MADITLTPTRFENGIWEGHLSSPKTPVIEVLCHSETIPGIEVAPDSDGWNLRFPVPVSALSEGIHTFVICDATSGQKLESFSVIGSPAADDLQAEVALLRAELDMLKRAFRRMQSQDR